MIIKCDKTDEKKVLDYIGGDYPLCLYLYLDLLEYGFDSDRTDVYIQYKGEEIIAVMLSYYTCLHIFSRDNTLDADEMGKFIGEKGFLMVYCTAPSAKSVFEKLPENVKDRADISIGWVATVKEIDKNPKGLSVLAQKQDIDQIVRLICDDEDIGRNYKYDVLKKRLTERNAEGYSRNLVIRDGDTVVAHACTNAETDKIAIVAELLVRKEYRRQGFASEIWRELCSRLLSEGKEIYSFYFIDESRALHKKIGFYEICEWGKIVIV